MCQLKKTQPTQFHPQGRNIPMIENNYPKIVEIPAQGRDSKLGGRTPCYTGLDPYHFAIPGLDPYLAILGLTPTCYPWLDPYLAILGLTPTTLLSRA